MEKEKNELQSRRDFFKNAAKKSLPILGAIILTTSPLLLKAETPYGCNGNCRYDCTNGCTGCRYTCDGSCKNSCKDYCKWSSR